MNKVRLPMENIKITENRIRASTKTPEEYETLKKSIRLLGLSNPIIVTRDLELISGYWRLKVFKELNKENPDNVEFFDIPTLIVTPQEEVADLYLDITETRSTDYMKDTGIDRISMIYNSKFNNGKSLEDFLNISTNELEMRKMVGSSIRLGFFPEEIVEKYKKEKMSSFDMFELIKKEVEVESAPESPVETTPEVPVVKKFDINKWL